AGQRGPPGELPGDGGRGGLAALSPGVQLTSPARRRQNCAAAARVNGAGPRPVGQEKPMSRYSLYVPLEAKPGKEAEVAEFLRSVVPLVNAAPGTTAWFAIQESPSRFAIFDTFDDEAGREAHLNGKVAAALMEKARSGDLFAKAPEIHKIEIMADKLPH